MRFLPQADLVNRCLTNNLLPTGDVVIQDGNLTTGVENYKEFFHAAVNIAGETQDFDGNGVYVRLQPGGGPVAVREHLAPYLPGHPLVRVGGELSDRKGLNRQGGGIFCGERSSPTIRETS